MTIDDAVLIDYALGTVSRELAAEVESFLRTHPEAAREVRRMQDDLATLVMSLPPEPLEGGAEDRLVERLHETATPPLPSDRLRGAAARRSPRWVALGVAVALGAAAWLILVPLMRTDRVARTVERYQSQPGALSSRLITEDGRELGTLVRLPDDRLFVAFDEPPAGGVYRLWLVNEEGSTPLGVVEGRSYLSDPVTEGGDLAITLEPPGESEGPLAAPLVLEPL